MQFVTIVDHSKNNAHKNVQIDDQINNEENGTPIIVIVCWQSAQKQKSYRSFLFYDLRIHLDRPRCRDAQVYSHYIWIVGCCNKNIEIPECLKDIR